MIFQLSSLNCQLSTVHCQLNCFFNFQLSLSFKFQLSIVCEFSIEQMTVKNSLSKCLFVTLKMQDSLLES